MAKRCSEVNKILDEADEYGVLDDHKFACLIHDFLISEGGYVIDVGGQFNVNAAVALKLEKKIKKHPWLWKKFFMVG